MNSKIPRAFLGLILFASLMSMAAGDGAAPSFRVVSGDTTIWKRAAFTLHPNVYVRPVRPAPLDDAMLF